MLSYESILALAVIAISLFVIATKRFLATGALIIGNFLVFLISSFGRRVQICEGGVVCDPAIHSSEQVLGARTYIQQELGLQAASLAAWEPISFLQLLTHMFVHADFFHLLGNVIVLLAFALPFEERIGARRFLAIYLISGLAAAFAQTAFIWGHNTVMMGASGAVFGIIGAFAGAYPNLVLPLPLPLGFIMIFVRMRVIIAAAVFAGQQLVFQYLSAYNPGDNTAYFAHLGGLVAGLLLGRTRIRGHIDPAMAGRPAAQAVLDMDKLRPFAQSLRAQNALVHMSVSLDDPQLARIWADKFLEHASCKQHGGPIKIEGGNVVCPSGDKHDVRAGPR